MTQGSSPLHFWYDAQNRPALVQFNGTKYAYIHNLQGDIVGLIDTSGTEVVKYMYDPWGKILSASGSLASSLGAIQPFRYRGYVYDAETGLYYLRSRYYNLAWGRFINSDALTCKNLFAYCHNTPSNYRDVNGYSDRFAGEDFTITSNDSLRDNMVHVLNKGSDELMNMTDFFELLSDMKGWEYSENACYYGKIDCVGVYRFPMYWYYSQNAYKSLGANGTTVEYLYDHGLYEDNMGEVIKKKGLITDTTVLVKGMALIRYGKKKNKKTGKWEMAYLHVAIYVGDYFSGIKNGVIEAVESGVVVREMEESERINGVFTHCGFFKGLSYIWLE